MRVVIYKGSFQYDVVTDFGNSIGQLLEQNGVEVVYVDLLSPSVNEKILQAFQTHVDFVLSFNGIGCDYTIDDQSLYDYVDTVFVMWLVDHPAHLYQRIMKPIKNKIVICIDETHVEYIETHIDSNIVTSFIPHGTDIEPLQFDVNTKEYDLVFAGHINNVSEWDKKISDLEKLIPNLKDIVSKELQMDGNINLGKLMENIYKIFPSLQIVVNDQKEVEIQIIQYIDRYIRSVKRNYIIQKLLDSKLKIDFFGIIPEDHKFHHSPFFEYHGIVEFNEMKKIFRKSKIVLNVLPNFPNGGHERIFTSMMCGALPLSDANTYLDENIKDILTFDYNKMDEGIRLINEVLNNDELLRAKIINNYQLVIEKHSWSNRVEELIYVVREAKQYFNQLS